MTLTRRELFGVLPCGLTGLLMGARQPDPLKGDPFSVYTHVFVRDGFVTPSATHSELLWALIDTADSLTDRGMRVTAASWFHWDREVHNMERDRRPSGDGWYNLLRATGRLDANATHASNRAAILACAPIDPAKQALLHQWIVEAK